MRRSMMLLAIILTLVTPAAPLLAGQVKVVRALPAGMLGGVSITGVDVTFDGKFATEQAESDAKAARKRVAAGLPATDPAAYPSGDEIAANYPTLPFKQMFPLVLRDGVRRWGLREGRAVRLEIVLETLKTADMAMAMMLGSSDRLAGTVTIRDAATGEDLGQLRINVVNGHAGWGGMLIRGGGVREELASEFSLELCRYLSGRKRPVTAA